MSKEPGNHSRTAHNKAYLFLVVVLIFWVGYSFTALKPIDPSTAQNFADTIESYITDGLRVLALAVFMIAIKKGSVEGGFQNTLPQSLGRSAWRSLMTTAAFFSGLIYFINPYSIYSPKLFPPITIPTRQTKVSQYLELDYTPDLIVMGTSRSYQIQQSYIQEKFGFSLFHFGVSNGAIYDYLLQLNLIAAQDQNPIPEVIMVELWPNLESNQYLTAQNSPQILIPYMDLNTVRLYFQARYLDLININQIIDSIFILQRAANPPQSSTIVKPSPEAVRQAFEDKLSLQLHDHPPECSELNPVGRQKLKEFVQLAYQNDAAVILYFSPWQPTYYEVNIQDNPVYLGCKTLFEAEVIQLQLDFDNLYFLDYSDMSVIHGYGDERGFLDAHHLTVLNSNLLIDAAAETIQDAYEWATEQRGG